MLLDCPSSTRWKRLSAGRTFSGCVNRWSAGIDKGDGDRVGDCMVHNPGYDFNDDNIAIGAAYWALLAERFLTD